MTDIVEKLREEPHRVAPGLVLEAAAEIEHLRAALRAIAACDVRDDMDVAMEIAREALGE